jgi:TonB family protein
MKNKVTIMNNRQGLADEEIDRFKNFDALLSKYKAAPISSGKMYGVKLIMSIVIIAGITFSVFYLTKDNAEQITTHKQANEVINAEEKGSNKVLTDTINTSAQNQLDSEQKPVQKQTLKQKPEVKKETPISSTTPVYIQAEPVEGYAHLYDYFNKELIYPAVALQDSIQGVLTVSFTINKDGLPENLQFTNSLGEPFEEEAKRLILNMPVWKPATLNNQPVASRLSLPLTFQIQAIKKTN